MDNFIMWITAFTIILNAIGGHFWGAGPLSFLQINESAGFFAAVAAVWNTVLAFIAMVTFQIPGLIWISMFTDAVIGVWVIKLIRGV